MFPIRKKSKVNFVDDKLFVFALLSKKFFKKYLANDFSAASDTFIICISHPRIFKSLSEYLPVSKMVTYNLHIKHVIVPT